MSYETTAAPLTELEDSSEIPQIARFSTAKGSVYSYDAEGKTTRFKATTGEQHERQDLTLFLPLTPEQKQKFLDATHLETRKVYAVERLPDDSYRILRDVSGIGDPNRVYLGVFKDGKMLGANPAFLHPVVGYNVFDTRHYQEDSKWLTERHLGNRVTEITYKD